MPAFSTRRETGSQREKAGKLHVNSRELGERISVVSTPQSPSRIDTDQLFHAPEWTWKKKHSVGWWTKPKWQDILIGAEGLRLEEWQRQGLLETIKRGPNRIVYRAKLPQGTVYIKHFLVPSFREKWRQWVRRGKSRNEAKRAFALAAQGVLTIEPIALGEVRRRKLLYDNYLVSPEISGAVPLDEFLSIAFPSESSVQNCKIRQSLIRELAKLTARLHNAGAVHQDFHAGNVLVKKLPFGWLELAIIDLDALRFRQTLSWNEACKSLAQLNHGFTWRSSRSERLRFLSVYLNERSIPGPDLHSFAQSIESATQLWAERLWRRSSRRCENTNKYFYIRKSRGAWAVAARSIDPSDTERLLADPDGPFIEATTKILKDSRTTTVSELSLPVAGKLTSVIYKRFNRKKRFDPWLNLFRPSRGWRAWKSGHDVAVRGVPTPANLLYIRQTSRPGSRFSRYFQFLPRNTYLLTLKAEPSMTLADWIRGDLTEYQEIERRTLTRRYTVALAQLIRLLHSRSLSHRDLKAANILILGDPALPEPELSLIDLVGVELRHPIGQRRKIQNLARLHLSLLEVRGRTRTDTLRFLRSYLGFAGTLPNQWKQIWRGIDRAAGNKVAQNQKRGRVLS